MNAALQGRAAAGINLIGGRLCLDFVNTIGARRTSAAGQLTIRDEKLADYLDLVAWGQHAGAIGAAEAEALVRESWLRPHAAEKALREGMILREAMYSLFKAMLEELRPGERALAILNRVLQEARQARELTKVDGGFHWKWRSAAPSLERIVWAVSLSAAEMLTSDDLSRLRQCGGDDCGWIFLDTTRNRSRYWCDMRDCGNRARVRRFRLRHRQRARRRPR